jgi:hypothetical protein
MDIRRVLVPAFVLTAACDSVTGVHPDASSLGGGLTIRLHEVRSAPGEHAVGTAGAGVPTLVFTAETLGTGTCSDWPWEAETVSNEVRVVVGDRVPRFDVPCISMAFRASLSVPLPDADGRYELTIEHGSLTDRYVYHVAEEAISISHADARFTRPDFWVFWRYPVRSFAYLCAPEPQHAARCETLGGLIRDTPGTAAFTFPREGEAPYHVPETVDDIPWKAEYFRYDTPEAFERIRAEVRAFRADVVDFRAYVESWRGVRTRSWVPEG